MCINVLCSTVKGELRNENSVHHWVSGVVGN